MRWTGRVDRFQRRHPAAGFPVAVLYKYLDDDGHFLAALITYYGFLAIFPTLLLLATVLGLVLACAFLAFSRYGDLKLGGEDEEPEFSLTAWFAMLFAAGMGIGLVFWGVAEPLSHYGTPPPGITPGTPEAAAFTEQVRDITDPATAGRLAGAGVDLVIVHTSLPPATYPPYQPVLPDQDGDGVPEYAWFSNNHSNQIVPLFTYGADAEGVRALADDRDVVLDAQGRAVAGSGRTYTDQSELGDLLLEQLRLGTAASAADHSPVAA